MVLKRKSNRVARLSVKKQMRRQQRPTQPSRGYGLRDCTPSRTDEPPSKTQEEPSRSPSLPVESIRQEQMSEEEDVHVEPSTPNTEVQLLMNSKCQRNHLYFKSRAIIPEREIEIGDVRHHELLELINFYQFHKLNKSCRVKFSKTLVREFYANLRPEIEEDGEDLDSLFEREKDEGKCYCH